MRKANLLSAMQEFIVTNIDKLNGQASQENVKETANTLFSALDDFIESKIDTVMQKRSTESSKKRLELCETLNKTVQESNSQIQSLIALSTAPPPPDDEKGFTLWKKEYEDWHATKREKALKVG